jgi:feruloyl esterase
MSAIMKPRLSPARPNGVSLIVLVLLGASCSAQGQMAPIPPSADAVHALPPPAGDPRCTALSNMALQKAAPDARITEAHWIEAGAIIDLGRGAKSPPLPAHCEVKGLMQERDGVNGQHYAVRFHLRLPEKWNDRFFFQGGGGSDGELGSAAGMTGIGNAPALTQGYAVVSDDSGHDNRVNDDPKFGGTLAFGFDPTARRNYGHTALKLTYDAAQEVMARFYGKAPTRNYYYGCSKGGQEGMAFAQFYPNSFDGIVAASPGFSLPRAAVAEAWNTQSYAAVARAKTSGPVTLEGLANSFSPADMMLVREAVLDACDRDDGAKDGIVGNFAQCRAAKVLPKLRARQCKPGATDGCLSVEQIAALVRVMRGPHNTKGAQLYAPFQWDAGLSDGGWRLWQLGIAGKVPALNVILGGGSLASVFTVPPTPMPPDPNVLLSYQLSLNFDRDAAKIYATDAKFKSSAWDDISARSPNLDAFQAHGGKMIVPHGVSDPVFSINDTLAWWREVNARSHGNASKFARVFPVPGMGHCGGGPSTDQYDAFSALVNWVEQGKAPARIEASAGPATPWPGRTRPLCAYPQYPRYNGSGQIEDSKSFVCVSAKGS